MKKILIVGMAIIFMFTSTIYVLLTSPTVHNISNRHFETIEFRVNRNILEKKELHDFEPFEVKGVNIGGGCPGHAPHEFAINEKDYSRWFDMIAQMNANTIRVYRLESPMFYKSLAKYNRTHEHKLYLIQNLDIRETIMYTESKKEYLEAYNDVVALSQDIIRALHGDNIIFKEDELHFYLSDVSDYILGYMIGIEWDEVFVEYINKVMGNETKFDGEFLYGSQSSSPFENFLANWGNDIIKFENDTYHDQKLITFANWAETDPFINDLRLDDLGQPQFFNGIESTINMDHIRMKDTVTSGIFVSYNIYPYYPLFLQYGEYTEYLYEDNKPNPYRRYLELLNEKHDYPVVISEYGVPTSRSYTYHDRIRNLSYGGLNEEEQSNAIYELHDDIQKAGCAGSLVFSWQDEWYKNSWADKAIVDKERLSKWNNIQCAEQHFGILSFYPEKDGIHHVLDNQYDDWKHLDPISIDDQVTMKMDSDAQYLHFYLDGLDQRKNHSAINIALDILPKAGKKHLDQITYKRGVDFIIQINEDGRSGIYVDNDYNILPNSILAVAENLTLNSILTYQDIYIHKATPLDEQGAFRIISRADDQTYRKLRNFDNTKYLKVNEVGFLNEGISDDKDDEYNSNADYCIEDGKMELRIPWQLLNFYDPSSARIIDNLIKNQHSVHNLKIEEIFAAPYYDDQRYVDDFVSYELDTWDDITYKERLRSVYYTLQDIYEGE